MQNETQNFEYKLKKAEDILTILNNDETNLEDSIKLHNEGKQLLKEARDILENAKLNIMSESNE